MKGVVMEQVIDDVRVGDTLRWNGQLCRVGRLPTSNAPYPYKSPMWLVINSDDEITHIGQGESVEMIPNEIYESEHTTDDNSYCFMGRKSAFIE